MSKVLNNALLNQVSQRINLGCLVDALSRFKKAPEKEGDEYFLMVETMDYKLHRLGGPERRFDKLPYVSIKLVVVAYEKMLTWEIA